MTSSGGSTGRSMGRCPRRTLPSSKRTALSAGIISTRPRRSGRLKTNRCSGIWTKCLPAIVMTERRPTVSIVTPSFNQAQFLEEAMRSVLEQTYPHVEYVVIDGGSSDGSAEIINRYASRLAYSVSEPDRGQYDAINKGFAKTTGEIMAWLNSDDKYTPWALSVVAEIFSSFPEIEWLTSLHPVSWNPRGQAVAVDFTGGFSRYAFVRGANFPAEGSYGRRWIQQESTF